MAIWDGTKPTKYKVDMGIDYVDAEVSWTYHTTVDHLVLNFKRDEYNDYDGPVAEMRTKMTMDKERALAVLEQLIDWADKYEGEHVVDNILKRIRE